MDYVNYYVVIVVYIVTNNVKIIFIYNIELWSELIENNIDFNEQYDLSFILKAKLQNV